MNETLSVIETRRSLRAYSPQPLSADEKEAILHAAFRAPTAGNMMLYSIIEVEDQALKDRLAKSCDDQPFIARAPFVLLFVADYQRWFDYFTRCGVQQRCAELGRMYREPREGDLLLACCDALIAAQNAVVAAESLGIGSCYIGDILEQYEVHREMFSLPRWALPVTLLCFGRPPAAQAEKGAGTSRFAPEYVHFKNAYRRLGPDELDEMFRARQERFAEGGSGQAEARNFGQAMYLRKFISDFSVEMSRSVREMIRSWTEGQPPEQG